MRPESKGVPGQREKDDRIQQIVRARRFRAEHLRFQANMNRWHGKMLFPRAGARRQNEDAPANHALTF